MPQLDIPQPLHLLTTLGTGRYDEVKYGWNDRVFETPYVQEALVEWLRPRRCMVLLTAGSRSGEHWPELQRRLGGKCDLVPVDIPNGRDEAELWDIFEALNGAMEPGCRHVIDVTHGFRSLPLIALLSALFLRANGEATVESIVYGAKDDTRTDGVTPIFDLSMFLTLVDWNNAVQQFQQTGDMRHMAMLMEKEQIEHGPAPGTRPPPGVAHSLGHIARSLELVSASLLANHPWDACGKFQRLTQLVRKGEGEIGRWAKPFLRPLDQILDEFSFLRDAGLDSLRQMTAWFARRGHVVQALTLAREWVVSATCELAGLPPLLQDSRKAAEGALHALADKPGWQRDPAEHDPGDPEKQQRIVEYRQQVDAALAQHEQFRSGVIAVWSSVCDLRNTVAHCAMREHAESVSQIRNRLEGCINLLLAVPIPATATNHSNSGDSPSPAAPAHC